MSINKKKILIGILVSAVIIVLGGTAILTAYRLGQRRAVAPTAPESKPKATAKGAPSSPTGLSHSCSGSEATISWTGVSGVSVYKLRIQEYPDGPGPGSACGDLFYCEDYYLTSYTFTFTQNQKYYWWVHACNDDGCSDEVYDGPFACPPSVPTGLSESCTCDVAGSCTASLYWDEDTEVTRSPIRVDDLANGWKNDCGVTQYPGDICDNNPSIPCSAGVCSYSFTGSLDHIYEWWLHACNGPNWENCSAATSRRQFVCTAPTPTPTSTPIECWDECLGTELIPNNTFDSISDWHNWKGPNTIGAHLSSEGGRNGVFTIQTSSNGPGQGCWYKDLEGVDVAGKTLQLAGALKKSAAMTDNPYLALNANIDGDWTTNYGGILPASSAVGSYENVSKEISIGADVDYLRINFCVWNAPVSTDVFADWVSLKELSDCSGSLKCLSASGSYYCLNPDCEPPEEQDDSCQCAAATSTPTPTSPPLFCNTECISRGYESGVCREGMGELICGLEETDIGETNDCHLTTGLMKRCCCQPFTETPTPTLPAGQATLNFVIQFQGISGPGKPDKTVTVTVKNAATELIYADVPVSADENGIYSGTIGDINPGTYDILIKGWAHLQRKFENIQLNEDENNYAWTGDDQVLLAGDFDNNNKLNIDDISALLVEYTALSVPVDETNQIYDVNLDDEINIFDISLVLSNYIDLEVEGE